MLQIWDVNWFLDVEQCPCDVHFVEWLDETKVRGKTVFHFGTGGHHHIGLANHAKGTPNDILGITASPKEFDDFVKLAVEHAELSRHYQVLFGDIYLLNAKLLPRFDIATLFHLCEFRGASQDAYGGLTDAQVMDTVLGILPMGGVVSLFPGSFAFDKAEAIAKAEVGNGRLRQRPDYKSLQMYEKVGCELRVRDTRAAKPGKGKTVASAAPSGGGTETGAAKVFVFAPERPGTFSDSEQKLQSAGCDVVQGSAGWHTPQGNSEPEMIAIARGADAMMGTSIRSTPITRRIMEAAPDLRIVAKYTIGYDDVDVDAATELGIIVTHSPTEANWGGVAEGSMAMMLALLKKVRERDEAMKAGKWRTEDLQGTYIGSRMQDGYDGITIGIIGLGRIGRRLTELLKPWRVRILACDPYCEVARFTLSGVVRSDLETLLRQSDVVSLHCTLNETTRRLINAKSLAMMKPTAVLLNAARGGVVDERALIEALEQGVIAGAALDVFEDEPLPAGSPLRKLGHKVLLSAHMVSGNRSSGIKPGAIWSAQNVAMALRGEVPENIVNPDVLPRWKQRFIAKPIIKG